MKEKLFLLKAYFDKGFGLSGYVKYLLAFGGLYQFISKKLIIYLGIAYIISCFVIGWIWYRFGYTDLENEIQNRFNPFQKEVRATLRKKKFK